MRGRIGPQLALVSRRAEHLALADDDRPDRHVVVPGGSLGLASASRMNCSSSARKCPGHCLDVSRILRSRWFLRRVHRDPASDDPNDPCRLAGAAFAAPPARASDLPYVPGEVMTQLRVCRTERDASSPAGVAVRGGQRTARDPEVASRTPTTSRPRHRRPARPGCIRHARVARLARSTSGAFWRHGIRVPGQHPGRLAERRKPAFPAGGGSRSRSSTPASPTANAAANPRRPDLAGTRFVRAATTSSTATASRSTRTATAPTSPARSREATNNGIGPHRPRVWREDHAHPRARLARRGRPRRDRAGHPLRGGARRRRHQPQPRVQARGQAVPADPRRLQGARGRAVHGRRRRRRRRQLPRAGVASPARAARRDRGWARPPSAAVSPTTRTTGAGLDLVAPGGGRTTSLDTQNPACDPAAPASAIRQYSLNPQAAAQGNFRKFGIIALEGHLDGRGRGERRRRRSSLAENPAWPRQPGRELASKAAPGSARRPRSTTARGCSTQPP